MKWTGRQIEKWVGGVLSAGAERVCTGVSTDTRTIRPGDLYVPLVGERFDGHAFVEAAMEAGAGGYLSMPGHPMERAGCVHVVVSDTLAALGALAHAHLAQSKARVVAVTGTNGKTTTKEMIAVALRPHGTVHRNRGNHNNRVGLPQTALEVDARTDFAVLEMGMNALGEIAQLTAIAAPDVAVITSISEAHLSGVDSLAGVARAKGELFDGLGPDAVIVANTVDPHIAELALERPQRQVTVGRSGCDVNVMGIRRRGIAAMLGTVEIAGRRLEMELRVMAEHDVWNAALALGVVVALGLDPAPSLVALRRYPGTRGRLGWTVSPAGVNVIDDTYNANPASMRAGLGTLVKAGDGGQRIAVLGDMLEMGPDAPLFHAEVGRFAADVGVDLLFAVGRQAEAMAEGYDVGHVVVGRDAADVIPRLLAAVRPGDWVLVKGSRGMRMERVVSALLEGGTT